MTSKISRSGKPVTTTKRFLRLTYSQLESLLLQAREFGELHEAAQHGPMEIVPSWKKVRRDLMDEARKMTRETQS